MSTHRPFEDWILGEIPLSAQDSQALRLHVSKCVECRGLADGWDHARNRLTTAGMIGPSKGFAQRWSQRQATRLPAGRRGVWIMLAFYLSGSLIAAGLVAGQILAALNSPSLVLQSWIRELVHWSLWIRVGGDILEAMSRALPTESIAALWLALAAASSGLIVIWAASVGRILARGVQR
ncbi:MAG TPA: hypothetical protein VFI11_03560 [Anaerolineales bacterium]|nr:hypothetical protein [Anaerolineales bacterium]